MQQHLNKINSRINVKISCRIFDPSLNNKTTVLMMQTTQKDSIFKIINSLMRYMDKQALLEVKLAFMLCCISKIPLCLCFGLQIQLVVSSFSAGWTSRQPALNDIPASLCTDNPLPLVKIREGASVIHCR